MGKKWNDKTRILFEKKRELNIKKLTIAFYKIYPNNPYQLIFEGKHIAFFPTWEDAFLCIDDVVKYGIEKVRNENKRILKSILINGDSLLCYRCNKMREKEMFKWGHKYCNDCAKDQKKEYYYINKYSKSLDKYSSYEKYFQSLINKSNRKSYFSVSDLMDVLKKQNYKCALTGEDFILEKNNPKLPSIDRINPKAMGGEYNLENIQIIWHGLNSFKNMWSVDFIIESAKLICNKRG